MICLLSHRRYDAELKKAFHHLRQVVPCVQRNSTRVSFLIVFASSSSSHVFTVVLAGLLCPYEVGETPADNSALSANQSLLKFVCLSYH